MTTLIICVLMTVLVNHSSDMKDKKEIKSNDFVWVQVFTWIFGVIELTRFTVNCGTVWWALRLDDKEEHEE